MATISPKLEIIRSVDALKINPLTRKPLGQGQHIYAYCNIRTNQVIYSLTQVLRSQRNLKQLPDAGNNTKPPRLRKDLWRPLWTLTLPRGFQGEAQGLEAWKRLNALRYMHELYWTPPKELSRNHTAEEMEDLQERIEDRGGSKKENVYDLIKRQKKKLRLRNVMDQKANSIADLAAVLVEQEEISQNRPGKYEMEEAQRMVHLHERAEKGALEVIEARIARLNKQITELVKATPVDKESADTVTITKLRAQRYRQRRALREAQKAKEEMEHALLMVSYATPSIAKPGVEFQDEDQGIQDEEDVPQIEDGMVRLDRYHPPEELWNDLRIKFLRRINKDHREANGNTTIINSHFDLARTAREVLTRTNGGLTSETPEEVEQLHTQRLGTLMDMVQTSRAKIGETDVQEMRRKDAESGNLTGDEMKQLSSEHREYLKQIKVWNAMIAAYKLTRGSLEVQDPGTGEVVHLGALNSEDLPMPKVPTIESDQLTSETKRSILDTEAVKTRFQKLEPPKPTIRKPAFSMDGIRVTWQNIMDAEFAPVWPAAVQHEWMGITRHAAPRPEAEPRMTAQEYYEGKKRLKTGEDSEADKVRQDVVKSVAGSIIKRLIGSRPKSAKKPTAVKAVEPEHVNEHVEEATLS